ncbi:MAG: hypothetical protein ACTS6P_00455 [Candidatus Hodgkinia cicadicola]
MCYISREFAILTNGVLEANSTTVRIIRMNRLFNYFRLGHLSHQNTLITFSICLRNLPRDCSYRLVV